MSVLRRLTHLARGYVKTLGRDHEIPDLPEPEHPPGPRIDPSERAPIEDEPPVSAHRAPPKPKKRRL